MGFRSWLRALFRRPGGRGDAARTQVELPAAPVIPEIAPGYPVTDWDEVPAYLPVDPAEHREACIIASAIAAGDHPESKVTIKRLSLANPEYRRVACIATALGAGALDKSAFTVKKVYRKKVAEDTHAA